MSKSNIYRLCALLAVPVLFIGCAWHPPQSPYCDRYDNQFAGVTLPDATAIQSVGTNWTFSRPVDEVWATILRVVQQYEGVIGMETTGQTDRRLLFVHGQEMLMEVRRQNMVLSRFLDTWIAVGVTPIEHGRRTRVAAAWVSPDTGKVAPVQLPESGDVAGEAVAPGHSGAPTPNLARVVHGFDDIAAALSDERSKIAMGLSQTKEPAERWQLVPQATINEFFYHLTTQLYGPERWEEKYLGTYTPTHGPVKGIEGLERGEDIEHPEHKELARSTGNWMSARMRDAYLVVHSQRVQALLREIVDRLKEAAREQDRQTEVYIIASPEINAFSLPNGDIFVCSGLLEALDSADELAAVLAHELDHYLQHDTANRLVTMEKSRQKQEAIMTIGSFVGAMGGAFVGVGMTPTGELVTTGVSASGQIVGNLVSTTIQTMSGIVGESMASTIIAGYSQEIELRADSNGARYLWAAGYDVDAELELLQKLKDVQVEATKRSEPITSSLINAQPGLEERTRRMSATLEQLKR